MTDDTNSDRLAMIATKVERESRFTRIVVVICTIANLSVVVFGMLKTFESMPPTLLAYFMEQMPNVIMTQRAVEMSLNKKNAAPAPAADAAAK